MHFCLFKNGIARLWRLHYEHMLGQNLSSKHPLVGQFKRLKCEQHHFFFAKMALVCCLCGSSVAYSHHRVYSTLSLSVVQRWQLSCVAYSHHRVYSTLSLSVVQRWWLSCVAYSHHRVYSTLSLSVVQRWWLSCVAYSHHRVYSTMSLSVVQRWWLSCVAYSHHRVYSIGNKG